MKRFILVVLAIVFLTVTNSYALGNNNNSNINGQNQGQQQGQAQGQQQGQAQGQVQGQGQAQSTNVKNRVNNKINIEDNSVVERPYTNQGSTSVTGFVTSIPDSDDLGRSSVSLENFITYKNTFTEEEAENLIKSNKYGKTEEIRWTIEETNPTEGAIHAALLSEYFKTNLSCVGSGAIYARDKESNPIDVFGTALILARKYGVKLVVPTKQNATQSDYGWSIGWGSAYTVSTDSSTTTVGPNANYGKSGKKKKPYVHFLFFK